MHAKHAITSFCTSSVHRGGSEAAVTFRNCWRTGQRGVQFVGTGIVAPWAETSRTVSSCFNECGRRHTEREKSKGYYEFLKEHDFEEMGS
jgi:hypothetical protein